MDYFNGKTNEDFVNYFLESLHCRTELTQYIYPGEQFDPQDAIDDHIQRCDSILIEHIMHTISDAEFENKIQLSKNETKSLFKQKYEELRPDLDVHIGNYHIYAKVDYVDLRKESED